MVLPQIESFLFKLD